MTDTAYGVGEAALATLIAGTSGFSSSTVVRGKWGVLNTGRAAVYAILKPGGGSRSFPAPTLAEERWTTVVQVWRRYKDDGTSLTDLEADVAAIIARVDQYPDLNDSSGYVVDSGAVEVSECVERWKKGGGVAWLSQDIVISWYGQRVVTFA